MYNVWTNNVGTYQSLISSGGGRRPVDGLRQVDFDSYVGLNGKSRGGGDGQEDNVATPEVHQREEDVVPLST
jgi:hypothetical protein